MIIIYIRFIRNILFIYKITQDENSLTKIKLYYYLKRSSLLKKFEHPQILANKSTIPKR